MNARVSAVAWAAMLLLTSGCASRERYEATLQTFVGRNISVVMDAWGYPSGSFEAPTGNRVYVWDRQASYTSAPTYQTTIFTGRNGVGYGTSFGFPGQTYNLRCQTYFEVDNAKTILKWRTQGNDCRQ